MVDQGALFKVLRAFARTLAGRYDIADALNDLSDNVVEVLSASAAGVALCHDGELRFVTGTTEAAVAAERVQERLQAGPCYTSIEQCRPVPVRDVRDHHDDWPEFAPTVERVGFRAVLGLPLVLDDRRVGSLNVYNTEPRDWSDDGIAAGVVLADMAAAYILNASEIAQHQRTAEQLQSALDSRVLIEQAKGKLSGHLGVSPDEAFEIIRQHARSNNVTVRTVAESVVDHGAAAVHR